MQRRTGPAVKKVKAACLEKLRGHSIDGTFFGCVIKFSLQIGQEPNRVEPQRFHFASIEVRSSNTVRYRFTQKGLDTPKRFVGHQVETDPANARRNRVENTVWQTFLRRRKTGFGIRRFGHLLQRFWWARGPQDF